MKNRMKKMKKHRSTVVATIRHSSSTVNSSSFSSWLFLLFKANDGTFSLFSLSSPWSLVNVCRVHRVPRVNDSLLSIYLLVHLPIGGSVFVRLYSLLMQHKAIIMMNILTMQTMKNTPTSGTDSLDSGIVSATRSMNTVVANMRVTATDNLSPESEGKMNVAIVNKVIRAIGKIRLRAWNNDLR